MDIGIVLAKLDHVDAKESYRNLKETALHGRD
jgi:hypothetical protein